MLKRTKIISTDAYLAALKSKPVKNLIYLLCAASFLFGCNDGPKTTKSAEVETKAATSGATDSAATPRSTSAAAASPQEIIQKKQVPILCYHRIQDAGKPADYTVLTNDFKVQMKLLADSGYKTVLPDQLHEYLTKGTALPEKPVMITFDDTRIEHHSIAAPEMEKYGFKGVFFVMTIPIGKPNYMNSEQIKDLSDRGHVIGSHTWDHHNVKKLQPEDWEKQISKPKLQLEKITGKPVEHFAYPFGIWNDTAVEELKKGGFKSAFQLTERRSQTEPIYTVRRTLVPGSWPNSVLLKRMNSFFQ